LSTSFWIVPRRSPGVDALPGADQLVQQQEQRGRGVDRHRGRDLAQRDPVEQALGVLQRVDRHARPAHLAEGARVVRVEPQLGRQVEGRREARLPALEQQAEALVGLGRRAEAGVLAHRPGARPVAVGAHAAGERELAGPLGALGLERRSLGQQPVIGAGGHRSDRNRTTVPAGRASGYPERR
jgi:hypothetical protein